MLTVPVLLPLRRNKRLREMVNEAKHSLAPTGRLAVEEIYATVVAGAVMNFEYFCFIVCAAIIAGTGLATNNTVMIVASMLVSPLMGPIVGFTLATKLHDWRLFRGSLLVEFLGILVTFAVGFIIGMFSAINNMVATRYNWPTPEMQSRGEARNLVAGAVYAVPSGVAVALATANPSSGALMGVAIAASLLPPITNSGVCFGYAAVNPANDGQYVEIAAISLALFAINVVLIYFSGLITLYIKGVSRMTRPRLSTYQSLATIPVDSNKVQCSGVSNAATKWQQCVEKTKCSRTEVQNDVEAPAEKPADEV